MEALNTIGQTYKDYIITQYLPLEELQSTLIELLHEPTGARIMHIANSDEENLFALSFQTLPDSSNGVAHILEHSVLCGSKKFPIKDPFFSMTRRSLNTYMNALTGQDFTCYPASSQIEKDFYNLLEVYLDAVFYPLLKRESFLQEAHRLTFETVDNPSSPLTFQGVVYNEMKGAMNSPDSRLAKALGALLTPDLTYAHNSGGDPECILDLTLEELKEFHDAFYHPSRCLFFFYGNFPLVKHLDFLSAHVLDSSSKAPQLPPLPLQKRFRAPIHAQKSYPISNQEPLEKKAMVAISWLTASIFEQTDLLGLSLIASILMDTDASLLKKELLQSGLCGQADASLDLEMSEVPFSIVCKGCANDAAKGLEKLILETLQTFIAEPIAKEKIENALHQLEFDRTEIGGEGIPFGLTLFFRAALAKQHGIAPEHTLLIHSLFKEFRDRLTNSSFLPSLVRKYFLDNPHYVVLTMLPDPLLEEKEKQEELERLKTIRSKLTEKECEKIIEENKELAAFQEAQEKISPDCLPKVTLKDVPKSPHTIPLKKKGTALPVFSSNTFTNQILYADLIFDLPALSLEDLPLVSLYARMFADLGCAGRTYEENLAKLEAYTGGVTASLSLYPSLQDPSFCRPAFIIRSKALKRHTKPLFDLLQDFATGVDLQDERRLQEWLLQHATELNNRFNKAAMQYAIQLSCSSNSVASFVHNQWNGLPYFRAVQSWIKDKTWMGKLRDLQTILLGGSSELVLSCDEAHQNEIEKANYYDLPLALEKRKNSSWTPWIFAHEIPAVSSQAHLIASPVAFTAEGLKTCTYENPESALLLLATELLDNVVLHPEVREKGGAYGSGATYAPTLGNFYLYAYRDPQFSKTRTIFQKALEQIAAGSFDEEDLEEAKFGAIQGLDSPLAPGQKAFTAHSWQRSGLSFEARKKFRKTLLEAKVPEVAAAVSRHLLRKDRTLVAFLGQTLAGQAGSFLESSTHLA